MGSAASRCPDWDAKPCEAINDVDGGAPCDVPRDELEKAKARYDALKREHRKDQAALAKAGDALLEELGLAVAFHDAGSWTRVVARKNVPDPVSKTHEPHEHMHEPHSPGTWLLRERLRKKHPEGEVGHFLARLPMMCGPALSFGGRGFGSIRSYFYDFAPRVVSYRTVRCVFP